MIANLDSATKTLEAYKTADAFEYLHFRFNLISEAAAQTAKPIAVTSQPQYGINFRNYILLFFLGLLTIIWSALLLIILKTNKPKVFSFAMDAFKLLTGFFTGAASGMLAHFP